MPDHSAMMTGYSSIRRGVNSGVAPQMLQRDQLAWAVNMVMRTNCPRTRPGFARRVLTFTGEAQSDFEDGQWQGAGTYVWRSVDSSDKSLLLCSISGRIFSVNPAGFIVTDITPDAGNNPTRPQVWFEQGEMFTFIQDGQSTPLIFNGASLRRSNTAAGEIPVGTLMSYAQSRMTVVFPDRRSFMAGNIVGSFEGGTPAYNYRDSIISFTENNFYNGGGAFAAPSRITAIKAVETLDNNLNTGPVQVFTAVGAVSANYPVFRDEWFDTRNPLVTGSLKGRGALSSNTTISVNNDIWFRALDGIRSFFLARRDFNSWGNTPLSTEMERTLIYDQDNLLEFGSAVLFDHRLLMTCAPAVESLRGVYHRGLVALDFYGIGGISTDREPSYDGLWTGLRVLQILTLEVEGAERCFAFCLDPDSKISLYEITTEDIADNYGQDDESPIAWSLETPAYSWGEVETTLRTPKLLVAGDMEVSELAGTTTFNLSYRPDKYPVWVEWQQEFSECATQECAMVWCDAPNLPQYRDPILFANPKTECVSVNGQQSNRGHTFQARLEGEGRVQIDTFRLGVTKTDELSYQPRCGSQPCKTLQGCLPDDFAYATP